MGSVLSISVLAFLGRSVFARQMDDWQLLPRPERVTELYFTDYRKLPSTAPHTTETVTFTVHNLEHQTITYHYTLTAMSEQNAGKEYPVDSGTFTLNHDRSLTTNKTVSLPKLEGRVAVKVGLEYEGIALGDTTPSTQKQSIHYWVTANKPDTKKEKP